MEYTQEQAEILKKTLIRKAEKRKLAEQEMKAEAIKKAKDIALLLKTSYDVGKVYLFGSLVWRKSFTPHSDIDLYVESFPKEKSYWEAVAKSEYIAIPYPVTIVLAETAHPRMKQKIEKEGILL